MNQIVKMVSEKTGISDEHAKIAVTTVMSYLKDKMPGGIGTQVESFLKTDIGAPGNLADEIKDKAGALFTK